jgi:hypothetical protein
MIQLAETVASEKVLGHLCSMSTWPVNKDHQLILATPLSLREEAILEWYEVSICESSRVERYPFRENRRDAESVKIPKDGEHMFSGCNCPVRIIRGILHEEDPGAILRVFIIPWRSFISAVSGHEGLLTSDPRLQRPTTSQQVFLSSSTFGKKLYKSEVHPGFKRNEIDFGKVANSSKSGMCGTLRRSRPCHQSILSESHRRSEPKEWARSLDGMDDVGNSRNQTAGRNPGKRPGVIDLGPEKWSNPTQSKMWRTVSSPIPRAPILSIDIRPK